MSGWILPRWSCKSGHVRQKDLPAQRFFGAKRPKPGRANLVRTSVRTTLGSNRNGQIGLRSAGVAVKDSRSTN